jgi:hypothetical protein
VIGDIGHSFDDVMEDVQGMTLGQRRHDPWPRRASVGPSVQQAITAGVDDVGRMFPLDSGPASDMRV